MATIDTLQDAVNTLTSSTTSLLDEVSTSKTYLDAAKDSAEDARDTALTHKTGAETAKTGAEAARDLAYSYQQSAASAVAYQDLAAIAASKTDSAVDVFVYDTRKDSDGGAWRKRTQHTSWYNETLNTSTRGSRKEFPAVAVIVAESDQVTIYDGDDPSLPMWMVFNANTSDYMVTGGTGTVGCVAALNGVLAVGSAASGSSSAGGIKQIIFLQDTAIQRNNKSTGGGVGYYRGTIEQRNDGLYYDSSLYALYGSNQRIRSLIVNDIAMTVLPNAPIDSATGLPVPTIAVATDGGVSVIKDDGTVVDYTYSSTNAIARYVTFVDNGLFYLSRSYGSIGNFYGYYYLTIASSDVTTVPDRFYGYNESGTQRQITSPINAINTNLANIVNTKDDVTLGSTSFSTNPGNGIYKIIETGVFREELTNHITSDYNTGWMNGDIKLATLSDTDDTDVTGTELVTNGTFDTDSDWSKQSGWVISGGVATYSGSTYNYISQDFPTVVGKTYVASIDITAITAGSAAVIIKDGPTILATADDVNTIGTSRVTFTATDTSCTFYVYPYFSAGARFAGSVDNASVRLAEEDRSVNGNGLQVFGTVTKNPVATGADLVAYSGFSADNYLEQPYNSDLDFGTGDFCVMGWTKGGDTGRVLLDRLGADQNNLQGSTTDATKRIYIITDANGISFTIGSTTHSGSVSNLNIKTEWSQIALVRINGTAYCYQDGELKSSFSVTDSVGDTDHILRIGTGIPWINAPHSGSLALWRISATAPSAEQIAKIYEDEKVLFQENAKATLYGSSDAVTALAYDDDTELLHVGTSAGRSDFQGLRRVSNTTDAVGAAISASNGLIAED
jgi:hypothetical protein